MKKTTTLIGAGVLTLLLAAGAAFAATGGVKAHRMRMMKHMVTARIEDMEDAIQATPQQRAVIEQAKSDVFAAIEARQQAKAGQERGKLVALLTADKLDTNALYAMANSRAQEVQDLAKVIVPELQRVHDVLSPQQRQLLAAKVQQMHENRGQHRFRHRGGFGGQEE
jgi:Spy/CpxP family protein refolding chaperone